MEVKHEVVCSLIL